MPIYEYLCGACGHVLDALQKLSDEPLIHCPTCGEPRLKRQLSAPSFRLKGGGWYETDFKGKDDKRRNIAETDSTAGSGKAKETTESKPAAATTEKSATAAKPASGKAGDVA